jgi:hypothetical protein
MSNYIRNVVKTFEFDGDTVIVSLKPIKFEDTLRFNSLPTIEDENGNNTLDSISVGNLLTEIVPKYVTKMEGLKDSEGEELNIIEICGMTYFTKLVNDIGAAIILGGTPPNPKKPGER